MATLTIEGLSRAFGNRSILRDISLDVGAGSLVAILGASGSGKTTLLRLIAGFARADEGTIRLGGCLVAGNGVHVPPERRRIGYVAQEGALFPHVSVADNITFGLPRAERRSGSRVRDLLALVGLPERFASRAPHELSGGEQQRVALARALAPEPALVLLDEPFSALDTALRAETRAAVVQALSAAGTTAILVTHDQPEALSVGDPVAVLRHGRFVQIASPRELYASPVDADLARFVGSAVLIPGLVRDGRAICALGRLPLGSAMPDGEADIMIRPEQIRLSAPHAGAGIEARVDGVTFYGHDAMVDLSLQGAGQTRIAARVAGFSAPERGNSVRIEVEGGVMAYMRRDRSP